MKEIFVIVTLVALALSPAASFAFESCTPANRYFEAKLPKAPVEVKGDLPRACVEAAQAGFPARGVYGFCAGDKGKIKRSHPRPCLSEDYVGGVHQAIADVSECLDFEPGLAFATFNLESGAHVNAVGAAGDAGVGQLTKPAIEQVNRQEFDRARAMVAKSNSAACRKILPGMTKAGSDPGHRCAFITVPANPVRNVIYSVLLIKNNQRLIDLFWGRVKGKVPAGVDLVRLKERLTMLAYNAGAAGTVAVAAAFARQLGPKLSERDLNFENRGPRGLYTYVAGHFPVKGARRKRVAGYVPHLIEAARRTEARAGRACFEPQLFPVLAREFTTDVDDGANSDVADSVNGEATDAAPDAAEADRLVNEALVTLAQAFTPDGPRGFGCEDARAQFRAEFLPADATEDEMPSAVRPAYDALCDK